MVNRDKTSRDGPGLPFFHRLILGIIFRLQVLYINMSCQSRTVTSPLNTGWNEEKVPPIADHLR